MVYKGKKTKEKKKREREREKKRRIGHPYSNNTTYTDIYLMYKKEKTTTNRMYFHLPQREQS